MRHSMTVLCLSLEQGVGGEKCRCFLVHLPRLCLSLQQGVVHTRICSLPVNRLQLPASHLLIGQLQSHDKKSLFSLAKAVLPGVWPWDHVGILAFKVTMTGKCDIG